VSRRCSRPSGGACPKSHGLAVACCYTLAWRRAEVFGLEWRHLDLERGVVSLDADRSRTDEGREAFLPPALLAELRAHRAKIEAVQRQLGRVIPRVFVRLKGKLVGQPIGDFRKRWEKACTGAGAPGLLVHVLRRSGVRDMVRGGITEGVAMKISGHPTRSVFDRYNITSAKDPRTRPGSWARFRARSGSRDRIALCNSLSFLPRRRSSGGRAGVS
jgi:integrase